MTRLQRTKAAVVLVDFQPRLLAAMHNAPALRERVPLLLRGALLLGLPAGVTEQIPGKLGDTLPEAASVLGGAPRFSKTGFSALKAPGFPGWLEATGRSQVVLAGVEAHVCVLQTALDLVERGFGVVVAADATGSRREPDQALALSSLRGAGAGVSGVEAILFELLGGAEEPGFREILRLVK